MVHATQMVRAAQLEVLKRRAKRPAVGDVRAYGLARTVLLLEESLRREGAPSGVFEGATRVERLLVLLVKYRPHAWDLCWMFAFGLFQPQGLYYYRREYAPDYLPSSAPP